MATRRDKYAGLDVDRQIGFIHDDLDEGSRQFRDLRREVRATLGTVILVLLAVIAGNVWSNL